jgi:hypothetical protein
MHYVLFPWACGLETSLEESDLHMSSAPTCKMTRHGF